MHIVVFSSVVRVLARLLWWTVVAVPHMQLATMLRRWSCSLEVALSIARLVHMEMKKAGRCECGRLVSTSLRWYVSMARRCATVQTRQEHGRSPSPHAALDHPAGLHKHQPR